MKKRFYNYFKTVILSLMISLSLSSTCYAEVAPKDLQGYLNGVVAQQKINQSNNPKYAERNDTVETIDPMTGSLQLRETDMTLTGKDGLNLSIGRVYSSSQDEFNHKVKVNYQVSYGEPIYVDAYFISVNYANGSHGKMGPYLTSSEAYDFYLLCSSWPDVVSASVSYEPTVMYETVYNIYVTDYIDQYDYNETRYNLGAGWSFSFPSVQIYTDDGIQYIYYHDGLGACYRVTGTTDTGESNLYGYQGKDVKFLGDNGTYVNGDNVSSRYKFISSDFTTTFFAADGRILGIKDRFNNEIKFRHQNQLVHSTAYPLISYIEDSVGRIINFNYIGNNIEVIVNSPDSSSMIKYTYARSLITKTAKTIVGNETYQYHVLDSVTDPLNRTTYYENYYYYNNNSWPSERYDLFIKALSYSTDRYLLGAIVYPGSKTYYEYEKVTRNFGSYGLSEEFRIKSRYDKIQRFNSSTQTMEWSGKENQVDYVYGGDFTGYPDYSSDEAMPVYYRFWSESIDISGRKSKNIYDGSKRMIQTESTASNNEKNIIKYQEFDTTYKFKPTKTETSQYSSTGSLIRSLYSGTTYTSWGGISSSTMPLTSQQYNDPNTKALYTTTYSYEDSTYKYFLTKKQWYQSNTKMLNELYSYDSTGRIASTTNSKGEVTQYTYTIASNHKTEDIITKSLGNGKTAKTKTVYGSETNYAYPKEVINYYTNDQGVYTSMKTSYTYNMLLGIVASETDNENKTTSYTYDNLGRVTQIQYPGFTNIDGVNYSVRQTYGYQEGYNNEYIEGNYTGIYGITVNACTYYVNQNNNATSLYNQSNALYDAYGNLRQERVWDGTSYITKSKYTYDSLQRAISYIDAANNTISQSYDGWGQVNEVIDASGNLYGSNYNMAAQKIESFFVAAANIPSYRANTTANTYKEDYIEVYLDQFGRATERRVYQNWPTLSGALSELYTYDIAGNLTGYTDPNRNLNENGITTLYSYDELNRVIQVKDAINQITIVGYDALGNVNSISMKENAQSTVTVPLYNKTYDELGNLQTKVDPLAQITDYSYNTIGLATGTVDRNGSIFTASYDGMNQLKTISQVSQDSLRSIGYQYNYTNPFGYSKERMYLNGSATPVTENLYTYDAFGQVTGKNVTGSGYINSNLSLQYDDAGKLTGVGAGGPSSSFYSQYKYTNDRLTKVQTNGSQTISAADTDNATYDYYPDGKLKKIIYPKLNDNSYLTSEYFYNSLGRLTSMNNKKGSTILSQYSYTYDANGNITSVNDGQTIKSYTYDKLNRLVRIIPQTGAETAYTYDLRGNRLTEISGNINNFVNTSYTYNVDNKLASVTKGTTSTSMIYYADGLRAKKTSPSGTTHYIYNLEGKLIAESNGNGTTTVTANYVWGPDRALVKKEASGGEYYYLYNGHGDVIQVVDRNGTVVNNYKYDEWGNILVSNETISSPFKYAGEVYDQETGLYYLRARYYNPALGRFINEDTYEGQINNPLTLNLYTYCHNNPIMFVDPSGNIGTPLSWAMSVLFGVAGGYYGNYLADELGYKGFKKFLFTTVIAVGGAIAGFVAGEVLVGFTKAFLFSNPEIMMSLSASVLKILGINGSDYAVIGRYAEGVGYTNLAQHLGACFYSIPTELWVTMTKAERWAANVKFLDKMIAQGKEFILSNNAYETLKNAPYSDFAQEIAYLERKGYVVVENGWKMIVKK